MMIKDFSAMTPAEIETWLHEMSREELERRYEATRAAALALATYQKGIYEDLMHSEAVERELACTAIRTECAMRVSECSSHLDTIDIIRDAMERERALTSAPSQYTAAYDAARAVCGRIESELESESVATHTDTIPVTPTPRSRMESVALTAVCAVIALVLIFAITGVLAVVR